MLKISIRADSEKDLLKLASMVAAVMSMGVSTRLESLVMEQAAKLDQIGRKQMEEDDMVNKTKQDLADAVGKIEGIVPSVVQMIAGLKAEVLAAMAEKGKVPQDVQDAINDAVERLTADVPKLVAAIHQNATAEDAQAVVEAAVEGSAKTDGVELDVGDFTAGPDGGAAGAGAGAGEVQ